MIRENHKTWLLCQDYAFILVKIQPPVPNFQKQCKLSQGFVTIRSTVQELELCTTDLPLIFKSLPQEQQKKTLKKKVTNKLKGYSINSFNWEEKNHVPIIKYCRINVSNSLQ